MPPVLALLVALASLVPAPAGAAEAALALLNRHALEEVGTPAHARLAEAAGRLDRVTRLLCAAPEPQTRDAALAAWGEALLAWARLQMLRQGPAFEGETAARIQYWPDKHGTGQRQLARALQARDPALLDPGGLDGASVALQGLPLIERLLAGPALGDRYACDLAAAAAADLARLTAELDAAWPGYAADALRAGSAGSTFFSPFDVATATLRGLGDGLQIVEQQKLRGPLGEPGQKPRPQQAEAWRSGRSLDAIRANLAAAEAIIVGPGGFLQLAGGLGVKEAVLVEVETRFRDVAAALDAVGPDLGAALAEPAGRARVEALARAVERLRAAITAQLGPALGIGSGFSSLDGD